jgi:hypothetical protein
MPDPNDIDTEEFDGEPEPDTSRDEDQDERIRVLERGNAVGFNTIVKVVTGIGAIIGVIVTLVGYGIRLGEIKKTIDSHSEDIVELQGHPDKCRANLSAFREAVQDRFRQDENAVNEIRISVMAIRTEVRVRHEERTFTKAIPATKVNLLPGMPPGMDTTPVNVHVSKVGGVSKISRRPPPQDVQEDMAAEAADLAIEKAAKAAPSKTDDPLMKLTF